jgi:hypothetical protein
MNIHRLIQRTAVTVGLLCLIGVVRAQTVTLTASPASAIGSTPVTLTWSTTPTATSCTASGDWTGTKAASGTTTLAAITASKSYTLTCSFPTTGQTQLSWVAPTTNTDGSALTNLASYQVYYGTSATTLSQKAPLVSFPSTSTTVTGLTNGTWFFAVTALSGTNKESAKSNVVQKTIAALSASDTETVTVTPDTTPNPPTNLTVVDPVAYNVRADYGRFAFLRGSRAGVARIGAACDETRITLDGYAVISRPRTAVVPRPSEGATLVAKCGERSAS